MQKPPVASVIAATTTTEQSPKHKSHVVNGDAAALLKLAKAGKGDGNFLAEDENEEENWPAVDVGNLIIDLDADIDKGSKVSSVMSGAAGGMAGGGGGGGGGNPAGKGNGKSASGSGSPTTLSGLPSGIGGSQTITEYPGDKSGNGSGHSGAGSPAPGATNDKGLKMKIKRTKTGSNKNAEAANKHEIVNHGDKNMVNGGGSVSNRSGERSNSTSPPLNAAEVVNAVKAAVAAKNKNNVMNNGSKVKLTSGSNNGNKPNGKHAANGPSNGNRGPSPKSFTPSPSGGLNGQDYNPPAKKQKVSTEIRSRKRQKEKFQILLCSLPQHLFLLFFVPHRPSGLAWERTAAWTKQGYKEQVKSGRQDGPNISDWPQSRAGAFLLPSQTHFFMPFFVFTPFKS